MGRAEVLFAACAVAVALLAGTACAIASADPTDTPAGESSNESSAGDDQPANESTVDDANTYSGDNDRTGGEEEPSDAPVEEEKADDSGASDSREGRTANKMPSKLPEAPPFDIIPLPEELPPLPLEPPVEIDAIDVTMLGPGASSSGGNESPAMKLPAIIAPPAPPVHILGTSITVRGTSRPALTSSSRGPGEPSPPPRQPTTDLREPPITPGIGALTAGRAGNTKENMPRVRLPGLAASALPGLSGIIVMTAAGVCLGHRQATAANRLRAHGVDRFLA